MTTRVAEEPSSFALDVYFADPERADAGLRAHVSGCERCRAYVARLSALSERPLAVSPSTSVRVARAAEELRSAPSGEKRVAPRSAVSASLRRLAKLSPLAAAAAAAAVGLVWLARPQAPGYVGSKGVPAVQMVVQREGRTQLWDGKTPIRAGDVIALRAGCDRFAHVAVLIGRDSDVRTKHSRVYDGVCSAAEPVLPFTLLADERSGTERIHVLFSKARLDDARLSTALRRSERSEDVWVTRLGLSNSGRLP